jgi:hypothetical protein
VEEEAKHLRAGDRFMGMLSTFLVESDDVTHKRKNYIRTKLGSLRGM